MAAEDYIDIYEWAQYNTHTFPGEPLHNADQEEPREYSLKIKFKETKKMAKAPVSNIVQMTDELIDLIISWNVRGFIRIKELSAIRGVADIVVPMIQLFLRGR